MERQYDGILIGRFFNYTALKAENIQAGDLLISPLDVKEEIIKVETTKTGKIVKLILKNRVHGLVKMSYRANTLVPIEMRG